MSKDSIFSYYKAFDTGRVGGNTEMFIKLIPLSGIWQELGVLYSILQNNDRDQKMAHKVNKQGSGGSPESSE
jgi:hypothetical protein